MFARTKNELRRISFALLLHNTILVTPSDGVYLLFTSFDGMHLLVTSSDGLQLLVTCIEGVYFLLTSCVYLLVMSPGGVSNCM